MRRFSLVCTFLVFGAGCAHAEVTDPANMAHAIRESGRDCNEVKSMTKDPKEARVYHVVCDDGVKYRVLLQPDDEVLVEND